MCVCRDVQALQDEGIKPSGSVARKAAVAVAAASKLLLLVAEVPCF